MNLHKLSFLLILLVVPFTTFADFYRDHAVGWHWYDDPAMKKAKQNEQEKLQQNDPNTMVAAIQKRVTTALNQAIVEPTVDNVAKFIQLQEELNNRAEKVSMLWEQALLKYPHLNYSLKHPTNKLAMDAYEQESSKQKEAVIKSFAKKSGLFFFYKSTCAYCVRFAPILRAFSMRYGITVVAISMDGIFLPEFPNSKIDRGHARKFQVTMTPALYAVNPYNDTAVPVAFGLVSESELRDHLYKAMTKQGASKV